MVVRALLPRSVSALVASNRPYLSDFSDCIHLQWTKGHPERSETPSAAWTRNQWGTYLADALAKESDIGSLPHSPIPSKRLHPIPLQDILLGMAMGWAGSFSPLGEPPCYAEPPVRSSQLH